MANKMTLIVFSGTVDKLMPVGILASGAVAMGMEVEIYLTFWGLQAFRQGAPQQVTKMSAEYEDMAPMMMQLMQEKNMPSWYDSLKQAKELGIASPWICAEGVADEAIFGAPGVADAMMGMMDTISRRELLETLCWLRLRAQ